MASVLRDMQGTVIKYAEILSQILQVDVEIVDRDLFRVAGTGLFADKINENMGEEGHVYNEVMKSGREQIIMEPGEHPICRFCYKQQNCDETFEISMPIKIDREVIGVIGLVCFTDDQREHILGNLAIFTEFLEQISDLISSKAKEELEKYKTLNLVSVLSNIIEKVEQGIIVINEHNKVGNINNMAMKILSLDEKPVFLDYIRATGQEILDFVEYELMINNNKYIILGEEYEVIKSATSHDKVYIFTDLGTLENISTSISTTKEYMNLDYIIGESEEIKSLKDKIKRLTASASTVLIRGESGTGKELVARGIHMESNRKDNVFVAINCAAIPDALLESELFGYVKGAFTGADPKGKIGKIESANHGTLFLDEIGDMPLYLQTKLLRVLEEREIERLGSNSSTPVDIRVVAATNKDLESLIEEKMFREDLYYRLNVIPIQIPPLRERKTDIKILSYFFIKKYSKLFKKRNIIFNNEVWEYFHDYNWPGNVRELDNVVEYIMNMVGNNKTVTLNHLPKYIREENSSVISSLSLEKMEKEYIRKAIDLYGEDHEGKQRAAENLGVGIATLYRKLKKYNI